MAYYFVIRNWLGRTHVLKTQQEAANKPDPYKLGFELARYTLTEDEWTWSLNDLKQAAEFGTLKHYQTVDLRREAFWETLGLDEGASQDEIGVRFRDLAKKHHPDVGGSDRVFIKIRQAYEAALRWWKGKEKTSNV